MRKTALFLLGTLLFSQAFAESLEHTPPTMITAGIPFTLEFEPVGIAGVPQSVELSYRTEELGEWVVLDLLPQWDNACLLVDLGQPPSGSLFLEYYVRLTTSEGSTVTSPEYAPQSNLFRVDILLPPPSPDAEPFTLCMPLEFSLDEQVLIAISLQQAITPGELQIQLGGVDITSLCVIDPWLITYLPTADQPQQGELVIQWQRSEEEVASWQMGTLSVQEPESREYKLRASTFEVIHFEQVAEQWENYHRFGGDLSWERGSQRLNLRLNLAARDWQNHQLQPQGRFSLKYEIPQLILQAGDIYPRANQLVLQGARLRGGQLDFYSAFFSLQAAAGLLRHEVMDADTAVTLARQMWAVAPRFGSERKVSLGLMLLKSWDRDREESIVDPQENLVLGGDFTVRLFRQRFAWTTEAALSLSNTNTSEPVFSDEDFEDLGWNWPSFLPTPEAMENFITVNPYLSPTNPLKLTSLAWQSRLQATFPGNTLTLRWRHLGSDYQSFGSGGTMNDQQGFEVADGFRLFSRQLYIHLVGRSYRDNLSGALDNSWGTTRNSSWQTNVSWYPEQEWPTMHFSGQLTQRQNDVDAGSEYYTDLAGSNLNLRLDHPINWFGFNHRITSGLSLFNLVEDTEDDSLAAGSSTWQLSTTLSTELNHRLNNRLLLAGSATSYESSDSRSFIRLQDKLRYHWNDDIEYTAGLALRFIGGDDSYLRWRMQAGGSWRWHRNFNFNLQLQQVFYTGSDDLEPDFRFMLRMEQLLFNY
jgi:hypothetical protein